MEYIVTTRASYFDNDELIHISAENFEYFTNSSGTDTGYQFYNMQVNGRMKERINVAFVKSSTVVSITSKKK